MSWATCCGCGASLFEQLSWIRWLLEDPTNLSHSAILWFSFPGLSFSDWVSVCWEHQLCSEPLENTVCDPFCYIPAFNFIQNCDVPRLCTQINKQLNIIMGFNLFFFYSSNIDYIYIHFKKHLSVFHAISLLIQKSNPFFFFCFFTWFYIFNFSNI